MGPGLVFQLNQKGVGGDTSTEWPFTACWGDRWKGRSFGHTPHKRRILRGYLSRFGTPDSGLGPQGQELLLHSFGGRGPDLDHLDIKHPRVCNHCPTLQVRKLRLKRGEGTCPGSQDKLTLSSALSNWSCQGSFPAPPRCPRGTSKGLNPPPLGALGPRTAYSHAPSAVPCDSPGEG